MGQKMNNISDSYYDEDEVHEECGVFGVYDIDGGDVASTIYYGLFALQHRGQESCGIAVSDTNGPKGKVLSHKDMGLVNEVFTPEDLEKLKGNIGVGHVRYSTAGSSTRENAQPLVLNYVKGTLAMAHNGNLINAVDLREELSYTGAIFQTTIDSEVIAYHIARERLNTPSVEKAVASAMKKIVGAYSLIVLSPRKMIGARDPFGFKPLCIGKRDNTYVMSSETCALDAVGAEFVRDVLPGEIVTITSDGRIESDTSMCQQMHKKCIFEYIYFARPDSRIDGISVYMSRIMAGRLLAKSHPVDADLVVGVPESGNVAAMGYALESGLFPTLSKLADEGFVFDSYYQPLWYGSTLGGEYANLMGSPTKNGAYLSMCRAADNENGMYFSLANTLKRMGYSCYGFHDNDYTYYDRNITHPALGYEWIASGNGLEYQTDEYGQDMWPQSDLVMMEETFDKYTNDQPFHLYYLTVSGHVPYGYGAANAMSEKNKDVVSDLNYSDTTKAYLASQYEMEKMLEGIVERLEKRNLLDKTVIVLAGDHVPYDNMEVVDELAGQEFGYSLDAYRSRLVIWSGSMEKPVRVNKVCSSIDILPTLLNLMGAEYDSRLIIGRDILSDSAGLVLFPDRSYVTDTYEYNAALGTIVGDVSDETFDAMQLYVADKFTAADNITETGYYSYVAEYLGK